MNSSSQHMHVCDDCHTDGSGKLSESPDSTRILVVDDEESVRSLVSLVLEEEGYDVSSADCGEKALEMFKEDPFPVVITDIRMGEMDGLTLLQNIHDTNKDTEVIIITSHVSDHSAVQALKKGAFDFIVKPFDELDLISETANRALEKYSAKTQSSERQKKLIEKTAKIAKNNNSIIKKTENISSLNQKIRESVNKDNLTGLPGKAAFTAMINEEIGRAAKNGGNTILMLVRVNGLNKYSDSFGPEKANNIVIGISKLVTFRHTDSSSRYNEDTFAVLIKDLKTGSAKVYAQKVCERIVGLKKLQSNNISINIGVAGYPDDVSNTNELIQLAKTTLFEAELLGPNHSLCPDQAITIDDQTGELESPDYSGSSIDTASDNVKSQVESNSYDLDENHGLVSRFLRFINKQTARYA